MSTTDTRTTSSTTTSGTTGPTTGGTTGEVAQEKARDVAGSAQEQAGQIAGTAKEQAGQVAGTAAQAATEVAGTAKEQVAQVAGEAAAQAQDLLAQTRSEITTQAQEQTLRLARNLRRLSGELANMADGGGQPGSTAYGLVQGVAERGAQVADFVESRGPGGLVGELQELGRRRPGMFLLGLAAAGFATGRLVKVARSAGETGSGMQTNLPTGSPSGMQPMAVPTVPAPTQVPGPAGGPQADAWKGTP